MTSTTGKTRTTTTVINGDQVRTGTGAMGRTAVTETAGVCDVIMVMVWIPFCVKPLHNKAKLSCVTFHSGSLGFPVPQNKEADKLFSSWTYSRPKNADQFPSLIRKRILYARKDTTEQRNLSLSPLPQKEQEIL